MVEVTLPDVGAAARVSAWYARAGETVYEGDRLVEVVIPGATVDVPAAATGVVAELRTRIGDRVRTGDVLGTIVPQDA